MLRDPSTKQLTSEPQELLRILRGQRQKTATAPAAGKTGHYCADAPVAGSRGYPREAADAVDRMQVSTRVDPHSRREDLLPRIKDYGTFESILRRAANNKAPGPDEVPNELLKFLPEQLRRGIHQMFVAMWLTGDTPTAWKHSNTVMLYKKGDPTVLSCDNATCPVYTSAAQIPSFPPFPPQTPHNCVSPPHSQLIDTCATPFRAPDPAIMLTDTMMPLCRIVPASYQEYPKYMPGICSSTPDLFNTASSANLLLLLPL